MEIRLWKSGDETAIRALFETVFGAEMRADFWNWRYRDHPSGGPMVMLAFEGDRLISHYGASYAPLLVHGAPQLSALSMTTMTHPDYRGRGLLEATGAALYEEQKARGIIASWGFPNRNVNVARRQKLGWEGIADLPVLVRQLAPDERFSGPALEKIARFDALSAPLPLAPAPLRADRSPAFLAWRFDQNPVNSYIRLILREGGEIRAWAVLKAWKDGEFDLTLLEAEDPRDCARLVQGCLAEVQARGGKRLNCWSMAHRPERVILERAGFLPTGMVTNFGGRALREGLAPDLYNPRSWKLDMIDSDLY